MHVNTDEDGFVKKMTYTPGNVHDSKEFDKLLGINKHKNKNKIKTCGEVYADSAYANKKNDEKLSQQNKQSSTQGLQKYTTDRQTKTRE
ncbi:hypothetical protein BSPWISOXPB_3031 [uncultured Gammaproteobacteria bacterium]|nr:hypothetical protein BSPWISOXPB_3031 [uncultured Gammaproteobacteria bacterium]